MLGFCSFGRIGALGAVPPVVGAGAAISHTYGALSRNSEGAGIATTATGISSGDPNGHWTISNGRLYPSAAGDAADLDAGPYTLTLDGGGVIYSIFIESNAWDVATQAEWDVIANQSEAILKAKNIGLRNDTVISPGVTGAFGTPFRRMDFRAGGSGLTIKGRFGARGVWDDYCQIDKMERAECAGLTIDQLDTTPVAERKFHFVSRSAYPVDDIVFRNCRIRGKIADPNGDYSNSNDYPNKGIDLISGNAVDAGSFGSVSLIDCKIEWSANAVVLPISMPGAEFLCDGTEIAYFYDDAIKIGQAVGGVGVPVTLRNFFIHDPVGLATDSDNPHSDGIQLLGLTSAIGNWANILIENGMFLDGFSRGSMQAVFFNGLTSGSADSGYFFIAVVQNVLCLISGSGHAITISQAKDCLVERCTGVSFGASSTTKTPAITVGGDGSGGSTDDKTDGGGNVVRLSIADKISAPFATVTDCIEAGQNGTIIPYADLFDGPDFDPANDNEAQSAFNPLVNAGAYSN